MRGVAVHMRSTGRFARYILAAGLALLAGCGSTSRPGASGRAPMPSPPVFVSIPVPAPAPPRRSSAPVQLQASIDALVRGFAGKFGVAVRAVDEGWQVLGAQARTRLPQQSVSKLWVAMTLMDLRDQGKARLDDAIVVRPEDLTLFHQPVAMLVKGDGYHTTVGDLLTRALTHSDNTANDRLLTYVGGSAAVRAMRSSSRARGSTRRCAPPRSTPMSPIPPTVPPRSRSPMRSRGWRAASCSPRPRPASSWRRWGRR